MGSEIQSRPRTLREARAGEKDEGAIALANLASSGMLDGLELTGFEDEQARRIRAAEHLFRRTGMVSLRPILPLLLNLKGKPYTLQDHFPFEPFFRTRIPRTILLKTGRQVSKSTSLAAQGIIFSNCIPHFSTLYITPLFEMVRRFSTSYVRPFIETSPIGRLFVGRNTLNSVLQKSFKNRSQMFFSFAYIDAERTRGIPADKNCLIAGTRVELANGKTFPIEALLPGDEVLSADARGNLITDTVTDVIDQGVRDAYEVTFSDGSVVGCTADERFRRTDGEWIYLSEFFDGSPPAAGSAAQLVPRANAIGLFTRGRVHHKDIADVVVAASFPSRAVTGDILLPQSGTVGRVRYDAAQISEKWRVGGGHCHVRNGVKSGICRGWCARHRRRAKAHNTSLGRRLTLGSPRLLGNGRRDATARRPALHDPRFLSGGNQVARQAPEGIGIFIGQSHPRQSTGHTQTHHPIERRRQSSVVETDRALDASHAELQTSTRPTRCNLLGLRHGVPGLEETSHRPQSHLPGPSLFEDSTPTTLESQHDAGTSSRQERERTRALSGRCGVATIVRVKALGPRHVWDVNTAREHAFFADSVLVHNCIDEVQDMDSSFLPIIHETMSGSPWGLRQYAGTPKTLDNTIQKLWTDSSQAEWVIKCRRAGCGHWNIPALDFDLLDMIGPIRDDISEEEPGIVCAKCRKPLQPRGGRWVHRNKGSRWDFAGYHVPQIILPMHCANRKKWAVLVGKREGRGNTTFPVFLNEVCGESYDLGSRLVTETDLKRAANLGWRNTVDDARPAIDRYLYRILAVDWGGGGEGRTKNKRDCPSWTCLAAMGMLPDGRIEVFWGHRSLNPHDHEREARLCLGAIRTFRLTHLVHDYTGAGALRETIINHCGYPYQNLIPVCLGRTGAGDVVRTHAATDSHPRTFLTVDKPRTLQLTCCGIRNGGVRFFDYDYNNADDPGLLQDFLALMEEKTATRLGGDIYTITKDPNRTDDFAQAVNIGCAVLWRMSGKWPNLALAGKFEIDPDLLEIARPAHTKEWDDTPY